MPLLDRPQIEALRGVNRMLLASESIGCAVLRPPELEIPERVAKRLSGADRVMICLLERVWDGYTLGVTDARLARVKELVRPIVGKPVEFESHVAQWVNKDLQRGDYRVVLFAHRRKSSAFS